MKPKKRIRPEHATAHLLIAAGRFATQWPDKGELERIGVAEGGRYPCVTSPDVLHELIGIALSPGICKEDGRALRFASLYERAPDFVLALLTHLRDLNAGISPIRKFLQTVSTFEEDGRPVAVADASDAQLRAAILRHVGKKDGITEEAVKMQRQRMVKLSKPLAAHTKARDTFWREIKAILREHRSDPSNKAFDFSPCSAPYSMIGYLPQVVPRNKKR